MRARRFNSIWRWLLDFGKASDFVAFIALDEGCFYLIARRSKWDENVGIDKTAAFVVEAGYGSADDIAKFHGRMKTRNGRLEKRRPFEVGKERGADQVSTRSEETAAMRGSLLMGARTARERRLGRRPEDSSS